MGEVDPLLSILVLKRISKTNCFIQGLIYIVNFPGPVSSFTIKEYHIDSVASEILHYKKTHKHPVTFIKGFAVLSGARIVFL